MAHRACPLKARLPDARNPWPPNAMKQWARIFLRAAKSWNADNVFKHAAAVSFYTLFSLAPITIIAITVAGMFCGKETAAKELEKQVTALVGPASAEMVQGVAKASETAG